MQKKTVIVALFAILLLAIATVFTVRVFAETRTFPVGTFVIPMDDHQGDRLKAFGFAHALLREGVTIFRIIEPPDIILKTTGTPGGDIYAGGPILVEDPIPATVTAEFPTVTVYSLTEEFSSDTVFRAGEPTDILVIEGIWGHTEEVLDWMGIPYTMTTTSDVEIDPGMLNDYNLVIVDCPGWDTFFGGTLPDPVANAIESFASNGGEVIFTDRAFGDLALIFPGYVSVVENIDGTWDFDVHNVGEFPSQYYGPSPVPIYTMIEGNIAEQTLDPNVRVILDIQDYGGNYRIGAFYFTYGKGLVEGFAYHPQEQTGDSQVLSASLYGNKFIHTAPVGEDISLTPPSDINPVNTQHTVTANVHDNLGNPIADREVTFEIISGPQAGMTYAETTNADGNAMFTYAGTSTGTDVIEASFVNSQGETIKSNQVTKEWTSEEPVGGLEAPLNTFAMLAPWLLLVLASFGVVIAAKRRIKY